MFQWTDDEFQNLRSQIVISSRGDTIHLSSNTSTDDASRNDQAKDRISKRLIPEPTPCPSLLATHTCPTDPFLGQFSGWGWSFEVCIAQI